MLLLFAPVRFSVDLVMRFSRVGLRGDDPNRLVGAVVVASSAVSAPLLIDLHKVIDDDDRISGASPLAVETKLTAAIDDVLVPVAHEIGRIGFDRVIISSPAPADNDRKCRILDASCRKQHERSLYV